MPNRKITELTALTDPDANDLLAIVDDPSGSPATKQITATKLVKSLNNQAATFVVAASNSLHKERADYICDGVDDQVEIQAAIDALPANGGKVVLLEGTFNIGARININVDNVVLEGYSAIIFQQTGSANNGIIETRASNVKILGLTINGNKAGNPTEIHAIGLYCGGVARSNVVVKDCYIYNSDGDGVEIGYGDISNVLIANNVMHDNREHDVHVNGGSDILIANNICYNNGWDSIIITSEVAAIGYVTIENNIVHDTNGCGIGVGGQYGTVGTNYRPKGTIVQGNILYSNIEGIMINWADNTIVANNRIYLNSADGIYVKQGNIQISITGNTISENNCVGIHLSSDNTQVNITGNTIYRNDRQGISLSTNNTQVNIIGNTINENVVDYAGNYPAVDIRSDGVIVDSNRICNNQKVGIYIRGTNKNQITNNYICNNSQNTNNTWPGIEAWIDNAMADSSHNVIRGNTIFSDGAKVQNYGMIFRGTGSVLYKNWIIENNKVWGSGTAEILLNCIDRSTKYFDSLIGLFMDCLAASTTHIHAAISGTGAEQTISVTNQPDVPRNLSALYAKSNGAEPGGVVRVKGIDAKGAAIYDLTERALKGAVADDGGALTDETTAANNATANDMTLLPATLEVGDAYDFGGEFPFGKLVLNVGTLGAGDYTITWKYWNGSAWVNLSDVDDETDMFKRPGIRTLTFTIPGDWAACTIETIEAYYIRAEVTAYTANGYIQPLGTQAWVIDNQEGEAFWFTGVGTLYGKYAFAKINASGLIIPAAFTATESVAFGISDKLGLSNLVTESADVYKMKKNNADATVGTVDEDNDTVDCATITGGDDFTVYYKSNLNTIKE